MSIQSIGLVGVGKMGAGLALNAINKGITVYGYSRRGPSASLLEAGVKPVEQLADFATVLTGRRVILLSIPAGKAVDAVAEAIAPTLSPGDILLDTGNAYWGDSIRRHNHYAERGIHFLDLGTSGGTSGALNGACFMIGGPDDVVAYVEPMLKSMATPGGYVHAGPAGSGHFVKLVHNGIEFGMLQAIAEGMNLLEGFPQGVKVQETLQCWRHGSVIRSWLLDLMAQAHAEDPTYQKPGNWIEDTGEVNWLITDALNMDVPVPVMAQSVMALLKSRDQTHIAEKAIIAMRHGFGGHPYGQKADVADERKTGKVGDFYHFD